MKNHSKYLVFVDESGDHLLEAHDKKYPIFILAFFIIKKSHYCNFLLPKFTKLKLKYFPTDNVIFHEREIRKKMHEFSFLQNSQRLNSFMSDLNNLINQLDFKVIAASIRKDNLYDFLEKNNLKSDDYFSGFIKNQQSLYKASTILCVERLREFLLKKEKNNKKITITFESRGKKEDEELKAGFLEFKETDYNFEMEMVTKKSNSAGLQIADLIARPIGIKLTNHLQQNRAYDILKDKIYSVQQLWIKNK